MTRVRLLTLIALAISVAMSCTPSPAPTAAPSAGGTDAKPAAISSWQAEWEKLIGEARKEGRVVIYTGMGPEEREAIGKAFKEKFNVDLEYVVGRGLELVTKLSTERRAALYLADVYIGGHSTHITNLRPQGWLDPVEGLLMLPEVVEPKGWYGGKGPNYFDKDHYSIGTLLSPVQYVVANTNMVKADEVKSYRDLLEARWRGQMVMGDPTRPGQPQDFVQAIGWVTRELGQDYLRKLAQQDLQIVTDDRLQVEWVARGKYPIVLAPRAQNLATFMQASAPLRAMEMAEGNFLSGLGGGMSILSNRPHPNAAKLFANWLLTREAQTIFSRAVLAQSARADVPSDYFDPMAVRRPGVRYFVLDTEEVISQKAEVASGAEKIFGPVMRR